MKVITWKFENLTVNMLDINGDLFTTNNVLCEALGIERKHVYAVVGRYGRIIESLRGISVDSKDLRNFKEELNIKRLKKDTKLWSEAQMIFIATKVHSDKSTQFIMDLIPFIKEHAVLSSSEGKVSREEFEELKSHFKMLMSEVKSFSHGAKSTIGRMNNLGNRVDNVIHANFKRGA
jgi:hypothetical protein